MTRITQLACACGKAKLSVRGASIVSTECLCNSCRSAGERLQALPGAKPLLETSGATRFELYRKDRVDFLNGSDQLKEFRLAPGSKTRRVVAACCNTPMFLEFQGAHWLSLYGALWQPGALPRLEMRTMTSDLPLGSMLPNDVPNSRRQSLKFFAKLLGAWVAMGFRSPKIAVGGEIEA